MKFKNKLIEPYWFKLCATNSWECMLAKTYICHHGNRVFWEHNMSKRMFNTYVAIFPYMFKRENMSFNEYMQKYFLMINPNYINITFNPDDLANSDVWWIRGYWNTITELYKEMKGTELKVLTKENIMEFLELNMKTIYFSLGGKK